MNTPTNIRHTLALIVLKLSLLFTVPATADELLKDDFIPLGEAEKRWTLSPDTGSALMDANGVILSGAGFPSIRTNSSSNFNDDGTKKIIYSIGYLLKSGQLIFWVRMDDNSMPSGAVLLAGGSGAVNGYRIDVVPDAGAGLVVVGRHTDKTSTVLWQNDPGVGVGTNLTAGDLKVILENKDETVLISVLINDVLIASISDSDSNRLQWGVGVGASAFSNNHQAGLQIETLDVTTYDSDGTDTEPIPSF